MEWEDCVYEEEVPYELELSLENSPSAFLQTGEEIAGILDGNEADCVAETEPETETELNTSSEYQSHEVELQELENATEANKSGSEASEDEDEVEEEEDEVQMIGEVVYENVEDADDEVEEEEEIEEELEYEVEEQSELEDNGNESQETEVVHPEAPLDISLVTTEEDEEDIQFIMEVATMVDDGIEVAEVEIEGEFSEGAQLPHQKDDNYEEETEAAAAAAEDEDSQMEDDDYLPDENGAMEPAVENKCELTQNSIPNNVNQGEGGYEPSEYSSEEDEEERGFNFSYQMPKNFVSSRRYHYSSAEDSDSEFEEPYPFKRYCSRGLSEYQAMRKLYKELDKHELRKKYNATFFKAPGPEAVKTENDSSPIVNGTHRKQKNGNSGIETSFIQSVPVKHPEALVRDRNVRDHIKVYRKWLSTLGEDWDDICAKKTQIIRELNKSMKQENSLMSETKKNEGELQNGNNLLAIESEADLDDLPTTDDDDIDEMPCALATWIVPDSRTPSPIETNYEVNESDFMGSPVVQEPPAKKRKLKHEHVPKPNSDGKIYPKPAFSYSCLIAMALKNCRQGSLPVSEIYKFMCYHFPYFKTAPSGWKNSVRHNLSLNKCFEKIEKPGNSARKGCLWTLNPAKIHKMDEEVQKWSRKDPLGITRAMTDPENLDLIEKGEYKRDYGNGSDEDEEEDFSEPATLNQMQANVSRTNSLDAPAGDIFVSATTTATTSHITAYTHLNQSEGQRPVDQMIHTRKDDATSFDFGTITSVQGNYPNQSTNVSGSYSAELCNQFSQYQNTHNIATNPSGEVILFISSAD